MARPLRLEFPGAVYHVTSRGNQGQNVFSDDAHRSAFLGILSGTIRRYNWICHAYCLMDNHYHLLIETPDGNLSKGMRQVNAVYTQYANRMSGEGGHLFQGRYKAILVEKDTHLLEVVRYVLLNPVRAGITEDCENWVWSSYRGMCGLEHPAAFLTTDWVLSMFAKDRKKAVRQLIEFVADGVQAEAPWRRVKGQVLLGGEAFCAGLAGHLKERMDIAEVPRAQRLAGRPELGHIFAGCAAKSLRDAKILEAVTTFGYSQKTVADFLNLHYSSISRIMSKMEAEDLPASPVPVVRQEAAVVEVADEPAVKPVKAVKDKVSRKEKSKEKESLTPVNQLSLF